MNIQIKLLRETPEHIPLLAQWAHETWGKYNPTSSLEKRVNSFTEHLHENALPLAYVALEEDLPVGMASLRITDGIRPEITPWLGSVYVEPSYRRQGLGQMLVQKVSEKAQELGFKEVYLFAFDHGLRTWYEPQGFQYTDMDAFNGHPLIVMRKVLNQ